MTVWKSASEELNNNITITNEVKYNNIVDVQGRKYVLGPTLFNRKQAQ